jgi:hypothetical protein
VEGKGIEMKVGKVEVEVEKVNVGDEGEGKG